MDDDDYAEPEFDQVPLWRELQLLNAGYPEEIARVLAFADVDLHLAVDLLGRGCSPEMAERILL